MSPRSRLEAGLRGQECDRLPFVIWNNKLPGGELGQAVLRAEACVIVKSRVLRAVFRTIRTTTQTCGGRDGFQRKRLTCQTPRGN